MSVDNPPLSVSLFSELPDVFRRYDSVRRIGSHVLFGSEEGKVPCYEYTDDTIYRQARGG